jgi:hypothetical protein
MIGVWRGSHLDLAVGALARSGCGSRRRLQRITWRLLDDTQLTTATLVAKSSAIARRLYL